MNKSVNSPANVNQEVVRFVSVSQATALVLQGRKVQTAKSTVTGAAILVQWEV
jgi:hypothetical protein